MIGEGSEGVSVVLDSGGVCGPGWGEGGFQTHPYGSRGGRRWVFRGVTMCVLQGPGSHPHPVRQAQGRLSILSRRGRGGRGVTLTPTLSLRERGKRGLPLPVEGGGRGDRPCRWREGEEGIALAGGGRGKRGSPLPVEGEGEEGARPRSRFGGLRAGLWGLLRTTIALCGRVEGSRPRSPYRGTGQALRRGLLRMTIGLRGLPGLHWKGSTRPG